MKYTPEQIKRWDTDTESESGRWVPLRSEGHRFDRISDRIRWAYGVLVGRYDALDWSPTHNGGESDG